MITLISQQGSIDLRSPEFGNGYSIDLGLVVKRSMSGKTYCTINTPPRKTHFFNIQHLNAPKRWELETFIKESPNQDIQIIFAFPGEPEREITARLVGAPFESVHQSIRNTSVNLEYEELPARSSGTNH